MFEFDLEEDGTLSLKSAVFQALGAASMCWDPRPSTAIFDSERATEIGDALMTRINAEVAAAELLDEKDYVI